MLSWFSTGLWEYFGALTSMSLHYFHRPPRFVKSSVQQGEGRMKPGMHHHWCTTHTHTHTRAHTHTQHNCKAISPEQHIQHTEQEASGRYASGQADCIVIDMGPCDHCAEIQFRQFISMFTHTHPHTHTHTHLHTHTHPHPPTHTHTPSSARAHTHTHTNDTPLTLHPCEAWL